MNDGGDESSSINSYLSGQGDEIEKEEEEEDQGPLGNPAPPPDVDLNKLRGDRIGDTVYSGKWCIQTVMKLMQSNVMTKPETSEDSEDKTEVVDMEEELQNEVGSLWDMTSNVEVCQYLHSVGAIESICCIIASSRCPRATEMCVGMLANIITHNELWEILSSETTIFNLLIQLLVNTDQPVLLEVTRYFNTALCHTDNAKCYSCLCDNGPLVTQELMRILSGSTNGDLLKQAAELTYNLMSLDEKEAQFCAYFADSDFVSAATEASKELGYGHENSGQNYLMEVFHYFTTYEAGVIAIENGMEQIAETCTAYLKSLCQSLNLSNNSSIITNIIAILNHIFCRHVMIRVGLMSSPSFIHCVLKTLVAVYRKLGCYNTIAYPKGRSSGHAKKSSSWKQEDLTPPESKNSESASWSERAFVTTSSSAFRTPEASPRQMQKARELEVSWSERRISSPLAEDDFAEEKWKRPKEKKRLKKKISSEQVSSSSNDLDSAEDRKEPQQLTETRDSHSIPQEDATKESTPADSSTTVEDSDKRQEESQATETVAMRIKHADRYSRLEEARKSSGFSPQKEFEEMDTEEKNENISITKFSISGEEESRTHGEKEREDIMSDVNKQEHPSHLNDEVDNEDDKRNETSIDKEAEEQPSSSNDAKQAEDRAKSDNSDDDANANHSSGNEDGDSEGDASFTGNGDGGNGDRYHKLLTVITEFLTDYFNNMRETITADDGTPCISEVMTYFNTQCSSPELRAIVKCVGTSKDIKHPLGRLLHLCGHFKAKNMKSVLLDFLNRNT